MLPTTSLPVLFPTDFRSHSTTAFDFAVRLASANQSRLLVLHVCNMPDIAGSTPGHPSHHELLQRELEQLEASHVELERVFAVADPGPEICRLAKELECGMIVMGVTIKCGPDQTLGGSLHDFVQQNAACPVVTLCQQPLEVPDDSRFR